MEDNNVTKEILSFSIFLNKNHHIINDELSMMLYRDEFQKKDILNDWLQFNWEVLVESLLCKSGKFLQPYGEGADCNSFSDRVRFPEMKSDYRITCSSTKDKIKEYFSDTFINVKNKEFYMFVGIENGLINKDSFDYSLLLDEEGEICGAFLNDDLVFELKSL